MTNHEEGARQARLTALNISMPRKIVAAVTAALVTAAMAIPAFAAETTMAYLTPGIFSIDGAYIQEGMNAPYSKGYVPEVVKGALKVVLPLTCSKEVDNDVIYCGLNLGIAGISPFVFKNYDSIAVHPLQPDEEQPDYAPDTYVASFDLPLRDDRENGVYPLGVSIRYRTDGKEAQQQFRIDFTISDAAEPTQPPAYEPEDPGYDPGGYDPGGYDPGVVDVPGDIGGGGAESPGNAEPASEPKVIIQEVVTAPSPCSAGSAFTTTCTLRNTSRKTAVRNMTVTYKSQSTDLIPNGGVTTSYIESIPANGTAQFAFSMLATETAASGAQKIDLSISYEGTDGTPYTTTDEITVLIQQKIRLEYDQPNFPTQVFVGDTMSASLNLYNKGKGTLYNVSVSLDVPGITPESSAFLGNMESGSAKTADIYAAVTGLGSGIPGEGLQEEAEQEAEDVVGAAAPMKAAVAAEEVVMIPDGADVIEGAGDGPTSGVFVISYEDEFGDTYSEEVPVETEIVSAGMFDPGMMDPEAGADEEPEPEGMPWWGWALIAGGGAGGAVAVVRSRKKKRELAEESADDDDIF